MKKTGLLSIFAARKSAAAVAMAAVLSIGGLGGLGSRVVAGSSREVIKINGLAGNVARQEAAVFASESDIYFPSSLVVTVENEVEDEKQEELIDEEPEEEIVEDEDDSVDDEDTDGDSDEASDEGSEEDEDSDDDDSEEDEDDDSDEESASDDDESSDDGGASDETGEEGDGSEDSESTDSEEISGGDSEGSQESSDSEGDDEEAASEPESSEDISGEESEDARSITDAAADGLYAAVSVLGAQTVYAGTEFEEISVPVTWKIDAGASSNPQFASGPSHVGDVYVYRPNLPMLGGGYILKYPEYLAVPMITVTITGEDDSDDDLGISDAERLAEEEALDADPYEIAGYTEGDKRQAALLGASELDDEDSVSENDVDYTVSVNEVMKDDAGGVLQGYIDELCTQQWTFNVATGELEIVNYSSDVKALLIDSADFWEERGIRTLIKSVKLTGFERIGVYAFTKCTKLEKADLGDVVVLGESAFDDCGVLKDIDLSNVKVINPYAFRNTAVESVQLDGCCKIENYAFYRCSRLTELALGTAASGYADHNTLGRSAFANTALTAIRLPEHTEIGRDAFSGIGNLRSVMIEDGVTFEDTNAFADCSVEEVIIDSAWSDGLRQAMGALAGNNKTTLKRVYLSETADCDLGGAGSNAAVFWDKASGDVSIIRYAASGSAAVIKECRKKDTLKRICEDLTSVGLVGDNKILSVDIEGEGTEAVRDWFREGHVFTASSSTGMRMCSHCGKQTEFYASEIWKSGTSAKSEYSKYVVKGQTDVFSFPYKDAKSDIIQDVIENYYMYGVLPWLEGEDPGDVKRQAERKSVEQGNYKNYWHYLGDSFVTDREIISYKYKELGGAAEQDGLPTVSQGPGNYSVTIYGKKYQEEGAPEHYAAVYHANVIITIQPCTEHEYAAVIEDDIHRKICSVCGDEQEYKTASIRLDTIVSKPKADGKAIEPGVDFNMTYKVDGVLSQASDGIISYKHIKDGDTEYTEGLPSKIGKYRIKAAADYDDTKFIKSCESNEIELEIVCPGHEWEYADGKRVCKVCGEERALFESEVTLLPVSLTKEAGQPIETASVISGKNADIKFKYVNTETGKEVEPSGKVTFTYRVAGQDKISFGLPSMPGTYDIGVRVAEDEVNMMAAAEAESFTTLVIAPCSKHDFKVVTEADGTHVKVCRICLTEEEFDDTSITLTPVIPVRDATGTAVSEGVEFKLKYFVEGSLETPADGIIHYYYRALEDTEETEGLPSEIGKYKIKAVADYDDVNYRKKCESSEIDIELQLPEICRKGHTFTGRHKLSDDGTKVIKLCDVCGSAGESVDADKYDKHENGEHYCTDTLEVKAECDICGYTSDLGPAADFDSHEFGEPFWDEESEKYLKECGICGFRIGPNETSIILSAPDMAVTYDGEPIEPGIDFNYTYRVGGKKVKVKLSELNTFFAKSDKDGRQLGKFERGLPEKCGYYLIWMTSDGDPEKMIDSCESNKLHMLIDKHKIEAVKVIVEDKPYDEKKDAKVSEIKFKGLQGSERLKINVDYKIMTAEFNDEKVGKNKEVTVYFKFNDTDVTKNYDVETSVKDKLKIMGKASITPAEVKDSSSSKSSGSGGSSAALTDPAADDLAAKKLAERKAAAEEERSRGNSSDKSEEDKGLGSLDPEDRLYPTNGVTEDPIEAYEDIIGAQSITSEADEYKAMNAKESYEVYEEKKKEKNNTVLIVLLDVLLAAGGFIAYFLATRQKKGEKSEDE